ncbi:MAG TPA: hypothetical protein VGF10_01240 [Gaiella sp.]
MIVDVNPFVYSRPVAPEDVVDREDEVRRLLRDAVGGHYVRLYAPRKYGKTSLLKKALHDGERDEGLIPILVDLYRVSSIADVTVRLERAYAKQLKGELRSRIEAFLQRTGVGLSLGALGISARLQLEPASDPLPALHALLELPLRLESSGGYRALIAFDEFQDIGRIDGLDGLIRSHIQHHGDVASYVFAGSEPALMRLLFETKDRPLYGSAVPMRLGRLADADLADYVATRFEQTGRRAGEALGPLLGAARGHPQRAMLLAHRLWEEIPQGGEGTLDHWVAAHAAALRELEPEFDAQWRGLDVSQQKTLRALLLGDGSPYRTAALRRLELTKDVVRRALPRLAATAEIEEREEGGYSLVDPLFAEWVGRLNDRALSSGSGSDDIGTDPGL